MSTRPFPTATATTTSNDLSGWINQVKDQDESISVPSSSSLEDEVRRSRLQREKRRSRLSDAGVRGFQQDSQQGENNQLVTKRREGDSVSLKHPFFGSFL